MDTQREESELQRLATIVDTLETFQAWIRRCEDCLEYLRERCRSKRPRVSTGVVSSSVARLARLEGTRNELRRRFERIGGGGSSSSAVEPERLTWLVIETAFSKRVLTGVVLNNLNYIEPLRFLEDARENVLEQIRLQLRTHNCLKVNTIFNGEFVTDADTSVKSITTRNHQLLVASDLQEWYDVYVLDATLAALEEFQERDSGWALSRILNLTVNVNKCNPMRAGCWLRLPSYIVAKRAVVNVRSHDTDACFAWSVTAALYPVASHPERSSQYPYFADVLRFDDIEFPVALSDIPKFEVLNDTSVNVFTLRDGNSERKREDDDINSTTNTIVPLCLTRCKRDRHVNLLYIQQDSQVVGHYAWIRNLSRLVDSQLSRSHCKKYICDR